MKINFLITGFLILFSLFTSSCRNEVMDIVYVNSYHEGYPPSDEIMHAIRKKLPAGRFNLHIVFLDSKRESSIEILDSNIDAALTLIKTVAPRAIIVSDDFAVKYLAEPYLNSMQIPVVFCGVNWSASQYNLNRSNITGMLEVLPLRECIELIKSEYKDVKTLTVLSENSLSEKNNTDLLDTLYRNLGLEPTYHLVDHFEEWKSGFTKANKYSDLIYLPTNGSIKGWDREEAIEFVERNIKKPVFTCDDFMMDYCIIGLTKVASEQGEWSAETVMKILSGISPREIPITENRQTNAYVNTRLSEISGIFQDPELIKDFEKIY